jgi:quercetin dioxygenase-like cupin family protein
MITSVQNNSFQLGDQIEWVNAGPGIQRQLYGHDDNLMLVKVKFEKGAVGVLHQHFQSQASYVESGVFELSIGNEKKVLKKGDGYFVLPNIIHGCICIEAGILIDVFSPHRDDFLK